ncbi:hypothetical protein F5Y14DRAFT_99258 [Nemania sp. NC0429]|nr:hypothetical protein F5Y14DRAFT_99258 [Nemania sp. NC0429]
MPTWKNKQNLHRDQSAGHDGAQPSYTASERFKDTLSRDAVLKLISWHLSEGKHGHSIPILPGMDWKSKGLDEKLLAFTEGNPRFVKSHCAHPRPSIAAADLPESKSNRVHEWEHNESSAQTTGGFKPRAIHYSPLVGDACQALGRYL